jgi:hypothetical protein
LMKNYFPLIALAALLLGGCGSGEVEISGKVTLRGTPPPAIPITLDYVTGKARPEGLKTRHYLVSSNGGLANVFVYIKSGFTNHTFAPDTRPVLLESRGAQFEPYILGVRTNQIIRLLHTDPAMDNFHFFTRAPGNREVNLAMVSAPQTNDVLFAVPEMFIGVKCDIHPWQFSYVCVMDHPFFAVTDAEGRFQFPPGLPPGKYIIEARHMKAGTVTQELVIRGGGKTKLEFILTVPTNAAGPRAVGGQ